MALAWLEKPIAFDYIAKLKVGDLPEIGFYCEAKLAASDPDEKKGVIRALKIMETADQQGIELRWRSLLFVLSLMRRHPHEKYNFSKQLLLYEKLEKAPEFQFRPIDQFRTAVLCYQTGRYADGYERFRHLRERLRQTGEMGFLVRDVWREPNNPERPRITAVRVTRILTEWRAYGEVTDLRQTIPLKPRQFEPPPSLNEVVSCVVRFERNGPLAVPTRFEKL
jgi:hypothetical protein